MFGARMDIFSMSDNNVVHNMFLRAKVRNNFRKWGIMNKISYHGGSPLYQLFGFVNYTAFIQAHDDGNPELDRNLKLLCGPNGYCVYKMLEAKKK